MAFSTKQERAQWARYEDEQAVITANLKATAQLRHAAKNLGHDSELGRVVMFVRHCVACGITGRKALDEIERFVRGLK